MILSLILLALALQAQHDLPRHEVRREICPGATYFYSGHDRPRFTKKMKVVCRIGGHVFLKETKQ